jgi:phospholipid/cholesterol/gamma-HCH transport system substrate-binding protein
VASLKLDPKTYLAEAHLALQPDIKLPADSTAKITSDGLLGGAHVAIEPGGALTDLKAGGEIPNTQGAVDIFGLIGQVIRPAPAAAPSNGSASAATPAGAKDVQSLPDVP